MKLNIFYPKTEETKTIEESLRFCAPHSKTYNKDKL